MLTAFAGVLCSPAWGEEYDIVLHQGRVLDPESGLDAVRDVGIRQGVIQALSPTPVRGQVRLLSDGRFLSEAFADEWFSGKTAVIDVGAITVVVTSRPVHLFDRALFHAHGQDPKRFDVVVIKSPNPQRHMYREWCKHFLFVDAPGSTSANLQRLPYRKCPRPIFPLDREVVFTPEASVFTRP